MVHDKSTIDELQGLLRLTRFYACYNPDSLSRPRFGEGQRAVHDVL